MIEVTQQVPDRLSQLIRMAIQDGRKVLNQDDLTPEFSVWHEWQSVEKKCAVCLAGAVIANTLGANPTTNVRPTELPEEWRRALWALDYIRTGDYNTAIAYFYRSDDDYGEEQTALTKLGLAYLEEWESPDYMDFVNHKQFAQHLDSLEHIANTFEEVGL